MISIHDLNLSFNDNKVLNGLTLSLEEGKIYGIVGLNGSGKTTLFNCMYGFINAEQGTITRESVPLKRCDVAYLETNNYFYPFLTGKEYLDLFGENDGKSSGYQHMIKLLNLPLEKMIEELSTGMKKKLAFIAILKLNRDILILDEPFNGMDTESIYIIQRLLVKLKDAGKTIVLSSHIFEPLKNICDHIFYLSGGRASEIDRNEGMAELIAELDAKYHEQIDQLFQI